MQEEISKQHTSLMTEIEEKKTMVSFGSKWVDHAKNKNACKVCSRPFEQAAEREAFIERFASVEYATHANLSCAGCTVEFSGPHCCKKCVLVCG